MHVFEFRNKDTRNGGVKGLRTLIIGDNYRAYEKEDGSVLLNDEERGYSFFPKESYEEFRKQFNLDWKSQLLCSPTLATSGTELHNG